MRGEGTFRFGFALFCYWVEVSSVYLHHAEAAQSGGGHTTDAPGVVDVVQSWLISAWIIFSFSSTENLLRSPSFHEAFDVESFLLLFFITCVPLDGNP